MFHNLKDLIPKAALKYGVAVETKAAEVCEKYRKHAPEIIRKNALDHTFPKYYKDHTLIIAAENNAWAQEIHMNKHELIEEINKELGKEVIKKLRAVVETKGEQGPPPSQKTP